MIILRYPYTVILLAVFPGKSWKKCMSCLDLCLCFLCTSQIMCVVLRMKESVVSLKTGVMSLTGQDRIIWPRIQSDLQTPGLKLTGVEQRRVSKLWENDLFMYRFSSVWRSWISAACISHFLKYFQTLENRVFTAKVTFVLPFWKRIKVFVVLVPGYYMYIEASRPRMEGDKARLLSPLFNVTSVRGPKGSGRVPYCVSFYYHMKGKHIGE